MSKKENQLQENTSHISNISYDIENMLSEGKSIEEIESYIRYLKKNGNENGIKFPENLELVDAFFDEKSSIGVCAFLDTNTGQTIVGFAGTNRENKYGWGDIVADAKIGALGGFHEDSIYEFEGYLSTVVEKAIYDTYELGEIINAQKLIAIRTDIMMQEIKKIDADIEAQFKGKSIDSYQEQLQAITVSLNYFNLMIEDCFGKNLK
ncbi:MAG: hypothetical protein ACRCWM_12325 [Sarcina sp.]